MSFFCILEYISQPFCTSASVHVARSLLGHGYRKAKLSFPDVLVNRLTEPSQACDCILAVPVCDKVLSGQGFASSWSFSGKLHVLTDKSGKGSVVPCEGLRSVRAQITTHWFHQQGCLAVPYPSPLAISWLEKTCTVSLFQGPYLTRQYLENNQEHCLWDLGIQSKQLVETPLPSFPHHFRQILLCFIKSIASSISNSGIFPI